MTDVTIRRAERLKGKVCAPPSKAYTQRMLIASALAHGTSSLSGPLISDDTEAALRAVTAFGAKVKPTGDCWTVEGAQPLKAAKEPIDCGGSGATLRFTMPVAALASESSVFLLGKSLEKRPIEPLLQSLKQLGVEAYHQRLEGKTSIVVKGGGIVGGKTTICGEVSSQFISGLMFACPLAWKDTEITLTTPLESKEYVKMTQAVLAEHGINIRISEEFDCIHVPANQTYKACSHKVPGDFSSAAFLFAAAALTSSDVCVRNLDYEAVQGDKAILHVLKRMGVKGKVCPGSVEVEGTGGLLEAVNVDARDIPDLVPVCTVLACYAKGTSKIHDAHRLRYKESDRLLSLYLELTKMGAQMAVNEGSLTVSGPCFLKGAEVDPHNDHRIAMACAVAGLGASGETCIQNAECVRKSYPNFFTDLRALGVDVVGGEFDR
ncbi:MAG: 3-phosphoshikimate 1-carboxyvinyltransferase [Candidatus Bathyarchaeota archaeon]|nr:3-phosphoshikimate 1-carboxyvinyltransferase [Candidatus Bathyarchaeota archaeon]